MGPNLGNRIRLPRIISLATVPPAVARLSHGASQGWEETRVFGGVNTDVQILWYLVIGELVLVIGVAHNALHLTITSVVGE